MESLSFFFKPGYCLIGTFTFSILEYLTRQSTMDLQFQNTQRSLTTIDTPPSMVEDHKIPTVDLLYVFYMFFYYVWPVLCALVRGRVPWLEQLSIFHLFNELADFIWLSTFERYYDSQTQVLAIPKTKKAANQIQDASDNTKFSHPAYQPLMIDPQEQDNRVSKCNVDDFLYYNLEDQRGITARLTCAEFEQFGPPSKTTLIRVVPVLSSDFLGGEKTTTPS